MRKKRVDYPELKAGREKLKALYRDGTRIDLIAADAKNSRNKTGYTGVSYDRNSGKFKATLRFQGKQHYLGLYSTIEEAAAVRAAAKAEIHGRYLRENEINAKKETP